MEEIALNKAIRNERMQSIVRIVLYVVLAIFLVRNTLDIIQDLSPNSTEAKKQEEMQKSTEVPDAAKNIAKLFVEKWLYLPKGQNNFESGQSQILSAFMTTEGLDALGNNGITLDQSPQQPNPNNTANNPKDPNKDGLGVLDVEVWDSKYITNTTTPQKEALVTVRVNLKDGRLLYLSVPVMKVDVINGNPTWLVSGPPALLPNQETIKPEKVRVQIDDAEVVKIKQQYELFLKAYIRGEPTTMYTENGLQIGLDNGKKLMDLVNSDSIAFTDHAVLFNTTNSNPVVMSANVKFKDTFGYSYTFSYRVTFVLKDGKYLVQSIQN